MFTASACNNPSDSITEIVRLELFDYYNQKQNEVLYINMENMDFLPPNCPKPRFESIADLPHDTDYPYPIRNLAGF